MPNSAHGISIGCVCCMPKERKPSLRRRSPTRGLCHGRGRASQGAPKRTASAASFAPVPTAPCLFEDDLQKRQSKPVLRHADLISSLTACVGDDGPVSTMTSRAPGLIRAAAAVVVVIALPLLILTSCPANRDGMPGRLAAAMEETVAAARSGALRASAVDPGPLHPTTGQRATDRCPRRGHQGLSGHRRAARRRSRRCAPPGDADRIDDHPHR